MDPFGRFDVLIIELQPNNITANGQNNNNYNYKPNAQQVAGSNSDANLGGQIISGNSPNNRNAQTSGAATHNLAVSHKSPSSSANLANQQQQQQDDLVGGQQDQELAGNLETDQHRQTQQATASVIHQQQQRFCSPQTSARNLFWNLTRAGQVARQSCPDGATGRASWLCDQERLRFAPAVSPDFSQCRSIWLARLAHQLNQMLEAPGKQQQSADMIRQQDEQMLRLVLGELALMARTKELFGEDLKRIDIMISQIIAQLRSLAVLFGGAGSQNSWRPAGSLSALYEQLFGKLANILSSLFDLGQRSAWLELQPAELRRRLELRLVSHLKEAGLMLASSMTREQLAEQLQSVKQANVAAGITVINQQNFNSNSNWRQMGSEGPASELGAFQQQQPAAASVFTRPFGFNRPLELAEPGEPAQQASAEFRLQPGLASELVANGELIGPIGRAPARFCPPTLVSG